MVRGLYFFARWEFLKRCDLRFESVAIGSHARQCWNEARQTAHDQPDWCISGESTAGVGKQQGPAGLAYDANGDVLYVVSTKNDTILAIQHAFEDLKDDNALKLIDNGKRFEGPAARDARVFYTGKPLNAPVTCTLLPNGNLLVAHTKGSNLLVEIASDGTLLGTRAVERGPAAAIFGLASVGRRTTLAESSSTMVTPMRFTSCRSRERPLGCGSAAALCGIRRASNSVACGREGTNRAESVAAMWGIVRSLLRPAAPGVTEAECSCGGVVTQRSFRSISLRSQKNRAIV
jgi:hypothetical protein